MILLWILLALVAITLLISYICFRIGFWVKEQEVIGPNDYPIPPGEVYEPHREQMLAWMKEVRALPHSEHTIHSHDGLKLFAKFYEFAPGAPMEIMFHGYRGNAERDLCGGVQRAFSLGRSVLLVDQRGASHSDGRIISFGANEHKDCLAWVDYAVKTFPDRPIILTGISMGATTVLLAAGHAMPENVVGVLADCGYTSAKEIIQHVVTNDMHLPPKLSYPFVWLGARLFGGFDLREADATKALANCRLPVIFYHGESDDFVPCYMSEKNYEACSSRKKLVTIPGAGHGLCYLVDPKGYLQSLKEFFDPILTK